MEDNNNTRRDDGKRVHRPRKTTTHRSVYSTSEDTHNNPYVHNPRQESPVRRQFSSENKEGMSEQTQPERENSVRPRRPYRSTGENRPQREGAKRPSRDGRNPQAKKKNAVAKKSRPHQKNIFDKPIKNKARKAHARKEKEPQPIPPTAMPNPANVGLTRLNKYLANAGICSRREADKYIEAGAVSVNGQVITELGYKVKPTDVVTYGGETLKSEQKRYFLLNKPRGYITTVDDPQERHTVMELVQEACYERIYPVGRLDRDTTGLLLFTNDGDLARKLTHPSTGVYKIYQVETNRPVTKDDMRRMLEGIELEDGPIHVDDVQYVNNGEDRRIVGVELHSGRNRIVRRIFESMGYEVHKLDRTVFAGLTKKDLPRGRYRELTPREVAFLKMI